MHILHLNQRNQRNQILFQYLRDTKKKERRGLRKRGGGGKIHPFHLPWIRAWRYVFDSRAQKEGESIDHFVSTLRKVAKSCNFCSGLQDSLLRDRIVFGPKELPLRKKLLQERHLTLEKAIDNCKSGDSTAQHLKDLAAASDTSEIHALKQRLERKPGERSSKGAEELTSSNGEKVLLMAKRAESVERAIILRKFACSVDERKSLAPADQLTVFGGYSSDSGESLFTFRLAPGVESVHAIQTTVPSKINAAMKIKGGPAVDFQVDTGATCDVLKLSAIKETKYVNAISQPIKSSRCTMPLPSSHLEV